MPVKISKGSVQGRTGVTVWSLFEEIQGAPYLIIVNDDINLLDLQMAQIASVVAPGMPHPVTQQGNRRL
jgi:hypothetical protein